MKTKLLLAVATLAFGLAAAGKIAASHTNLTLAARAQARAALNPDRLQTLIDGHMSSEAALAAAERADVLAVRADYHRDEEQQRAAVAKIRRDYRGRTETLSALHLLEKKELDAEKM